MTAIATGTFVERSEAVTKELTASHFGSGAVEVYATPAMINLMEAAALAALLEDGQNSVGISFDLRHLAATPVGQRVTACAEVIEVNGRKVNFKVQAWDQHELIGEGVHGRVIVNKAKFFGRIQYKVPDFQEDAQ